MNSSSRHRAKTCCKGLPSARVNRRTMSPEELDDEMEALQPARANRGRVLIAGAALLSSALFAITLAMAVIPAITNALKVLLALQFRLPEPLPNELHKPEKAV